jgi:hypothetical protein
MTSEEDIGEVICRTVISNRATGALPKHCLSQDVLHECGIMTDMLLAYDTKIPSMAECRVTIDKVVKYAIPRKVTQQVYFSTNADPESILDELN